jgi:hypothetical protein
MMAASNQGYRTLVLRFALRVYSLRESTFGAWDSTSAALGETFFLREETFELVEDTFGFA